MSWATRVNPSPHVLGIDDGPFSKRQAGPVPIVGVLMEGATLVEGVSITQFPVDGDGITGFLADWIDTMRWKSAIQVIAVGGMTIAGLAIIDLCALATRTGIPCLSVTRRAPSNHELSRALVAAGLSERLALLERLPRAQRFESNLFAAAAGIEHDGARKLLGAIRTKSKLPEPLRVAHLFATAVVRGQSRGRA